MVPSISGRWRTMAVVLALLSSLVSISTALQVTPGSKCASVCMDRSDGNVDDPNGSTTKTSDIVCEDADFFSSLSGMRFKQCIECLQSSRKVQGDESDIFWYLYNLRFAANVCLYGHPGSVRNRSVSCDIPQACGGIKDVMRVGDLVNPTSQGQLDFCNAEDNKITRTWNIRGCSGCLLSTEDSKYLGNFMMALYAGCVQRPKAGALIGVTDSLFAVAGVNVTDPPADDTGPAPPAGTSLDMGTIVGIAVGAALLLLGAVALFVVYWRRNRRSKAAEKHEMGRGPSPTDGTSITALTSGGGGGGGVGHHAYTMDYKKEAGLSAYEYGARGSGIPGIHSRPGSNADFYEQLEQRQQQQAAMAKVSRLHAHSNSADARAMPAHPAYVPRAAILSQSHQRSSTDSRGSAGSRSAAARSNSSANNITHSNLNPNPLASHHQQRSTPRSTPRTTPEPIMIDNTSTSKSRYAKTTESYAMQQYLSQADDGPGQMMPPPPPRPQAASGGPATTHSRSGSGPGEPANLPPPPPPQPKIPALVLPSVPKIRMPKKYSPPKISIEEATPVDGASNITGPMDLRDDDRRHQRFPDGPLPRRSHESGNSTSDRSGNGPAAGDRIVRQTVEARSHFPEDGIGSGRLYG